MFNGTSCLDVILRTVRFSFGGLPETEFTVVLIVLDCGANYPIQHLL